MLDKEGRYYNLGLPVWTYSADVLPTGGVVVYSRANEYTDASSLWLRKDGRDSLLVRGDNEIFAWVRWSPRGDKIAFLRSKIGAKNADEARQLWMVNPDGTGATRIAGNVLWAYPPMWSPDGQKLLIAVQENSGVNSIAVDYETLESNIAEYDTTSQVLRKLTSFHGARALYPSYSGDGASVVFVADQSGADEAWRIKGGKLEQLTNDGAPKQYPILP
ncbi:MAG: TolB family protein [Vicinamibacteria bacterium]